MLRVLEIVYLFSLANGLLLLALDRTFPAAPRGGPISANGQHRIVEAS